MNAATVHLDSIPPKQVWLAAQLLPGAGQIINKQYWKIPVFYAGMGSMAYYGLKANQRYHATLNEYELPYYGPEEKYRFEERWTRYRMQRNLLYTGAAVFYLASVADALVVTARDKHSPLTATALSALIPGLGQVYNQKLWKVPFVVGGIASIYYIIDFNQRGYKRAGTALKLYPNDEFGGLLSEDALIYRRDAYRRNRDMAIIGMAGFYLLNIVDAFVDANFYYWDISEDLALNLNPVIYNDTYASTSGQRLTLGLQLNFNF